LWACYYASSWERAPAEEGRTLWATTHEEEADHNEPNGAMGSVCGTDATRRRRGAGGLITVGAGYAKDEDAAGANKCSVATLHGTYLFAFDRVEIKGKNNDQAPFAIAGYAVFDGNGKEKGVASSNSNGEVSRNESVSGTYTVKADCTGTVTYADGSQIDLFIASDGSMFTFVRTKPSERVGSGFEPRGTAERVGD
jgi:hypothetical protein